VLRLGIASGDWLHPNKTGLETAQWGGSGWARLGQYISTLPFDVSVGVLTWMHDRFVIQSIDKTFHEVDIIYMQRLMHEGLTQHVPMARANGQKIINDLDDWYWGLDTSNMAFRHNHPKHNKIENTNFYKTILARSDIVTVSTPYIQDRISNFVRCPIVVLENTVDISRFKQIKYRKTTSPTLGWVGSTAHRSKDIETLKGILPPMVNEGIVHLYHGGAHDSAPSFSSRLGIEEHLVTTRPLQPAGEYPSLLTMDVGIVPLNKTPFNMAKSDIKGLEYAASGIPFIAQDLESYVNLYKTLGVGVIAKNPTDWIKSIKRLCDPKVREELGTPMREQIASRDINIGLERLINLISNL
jgi:glycosyltransferase involved in cell wall biosynthesis